MNAGMLGWPLNVEADRLSAFGMRGGPRLDAVGFHAQ